MRTLLLLLVVGCGATPHFPTKQNVREACDAQRRACQAATKLCGRDELDEEDDGDE